jgi:hypothetical protein
MSDEKLSEPVTLNWVGGRILTTINSELRDIQRHFAGMEARLSAMEARVGGLETRFAAQEDRMTAMLDLLVRVAARIGVTEGPAAN